MPEVSYKAFTDQDKLTLIELIKGYPELWDPTSKQRLKRKSIKAAYLAIAKKMNTDGIRVFTGRHFLISLSPKTMFSRKPEEGVEESL